MATGEHWIGTIVFEWAAADKSAMIAQHSLIRSHFDSVVAHPLQKALDRIGGDEQAIRLGRIEIDLGTLSPTDLKLDTLRKRIESGLALALDGATLPRLAPAEASGSAQLIGFLRSGELPWPEPGRALTAIVEALMEGDDPVFGAFAAAMQPLLSNRRIAERLARQMPAHFIERLVRTIFAAATGQMLSPSPNPAATPLAGDVAQWLASELHVFAADPKAFGAERAATLAKAVADGVIPDRAADTPQPAIEAGPAPPENGLRDATFDGRGSTDPDPKTLPDQSAVDRQAGDGQPIDEPLPLPISAAGAVLLHPFLPRFFDRIGLLTAPGRFADDAAHKRAVLLASFLATGRREFAEPETFLFKLLCGLDQGDPLPRQIEPSADEAGEVERLLKTVITQWDRLGRTSPDGLRETFLTRSGSLDRSVTPWRLRIERHGVDILLDFLPWPLSIVKTPFMADPLSVDWR